MEKTSSESVGGDVEKSERSCAAGRNGECGSHLGKQLGGFSKC